MIEPSTTRSPSRPRSAELGIDHRVVAAAHLARADRVEDGAATQADVGADLVVAARFPDPAPPRRRATSSSAGAVATSRAIFTPATRRSRSALAEK
jgi:hypothetical protein